MKTLDEELLPYREALLKKNERIKFLENHIILIEEANERKREELLKKDERINFLENQIALIKKGNTQCK